MTRRLIKRIEDLEGRVPVTSSAEREVKRLANYTASICDGKLLRIIGFLLMDNDSRKRFYPNKRLLSLRRKIMLKAKDFLSLDEKYPEYYIQNPYYSPETAATFRNDKNMTR